MSDTVSFSDVDEHVNLLPARIVDEQHPKLLPSRTLMIGLPDLPGLPGIPGLPDIGIVPGLPVISDRTLKRDITPVNYGRCP